MSKILIFAVTFFATTGAVAQASLELTIKGIKDPVGEVYVGLFNRPDHFLEKTVEAKVISLEADWAVVIFKDLPPGVYAVSVFHDRNRNGKLDSNSLGIPKEGFAFGNNAMGLFGPPSFDRAGIAIKDSPVRQVLVLRYF